ncbi:hypothetical protein A0J61_09869 [Choanephora cucurbitarum]|uniref:DNA endonuclease activator Ctp1 C-terminal domain-containing protein n=1 Tax=Choanephora cucurbitarum TaxID=101091 RepID=A0A1C7MZ83_9FUNG|nr:hypothetical protein A0J61_09869 [Choanephora cucurbitarum]
MNTSKEEPSPPLPLFVGYTKEELIEKIKVSQSSKKLAIRMLDRKKEQYLALKEQFDMINEKLLKKEDQSRSRAFNEEHISLQHKYESLQADHIKLEQIHQNLLQHYNRYKDGCAQMETKYHNLDVEHKALEERHNRLVQDDNTLSQQHKDLEQKHKCLQQKHDSLVQSNKGLQQGPNNLPNDAIEILKKQHSEEIERIHREHNQRYLELKEAKNEAVESLRRQLQVQHSKIMNQIRQIKDINHKLNDEQFKAQSAEAEVTKLSLLLDTKEDTIKELQYNVNLLKKHNMKLDEKLRGSRVSSTKNAVTCNISTISASATIPTCTTDASTATNTPMTKKDSSNKRPLEVEDKDSTRIQKKANPLGCISNARHRNGRTQLKGQACTCCTGFYAGDPVLAVDVGGSIVEVTPEQRIQQHSRHRVEKTAKPSTPPGFWELEFGSPPDLKHDR